MTSGTADPAATGATAIVASVIRASGTAVRGPPVVAARPLPAVREPAPFVVVPSHTRPIRHPLSEARMVVGHRAARLPSFR
jgi:hypothetical protein